MNSYNVVMETLGELVSSGAIIVVLIALLFALMVGVALWAVQSFAIYSVVKKANRPNPWLIWLSIIPIAGAVIKWYVLADVPGDKKYELFGGRISLEKRFYAVVAWAIVLFAGTAVAAIMCIPLNEMVEVPLIGIIVSLLIFVIENIPAVVMGIIEFGLIRDVLDMFRENKQENRIFAIGVTVADKLFAGGLALTIILFTLIKKNILPEEPQIIEAEEVPAEPEVTEAPADEGEAAEFVAEETADEAEVAVEEAEEIIVTEKTTEE